MNSELQEQFNALWQRFESLSQQVKAMEERLARYEAQEVEANG